MIDSVDKLNNSLKSKSNISKCTITFKSYGAVVDFAKDICFLPTIIELGTKSRLEIQENCRITGLIKVGAYSHVIIKKETTITDNISIFAAEGTSIIIGEDCQIASGVVIRDFDGHKIFNLNSSERLNQGKSIFIGEHCWLGDQSVILKGVELGGGSIVATRAVVTKSMPQNCICAGVPAKVIKENIRWER